MSAVEETPVRGLPTNWVMAAGRVGCGMVLHGRVLWQPTRNSRQASRARGPALNASAPQALAVPLQRQQRVLGAG